MDQHVRTPDLGDLQDMTQIGTAAPPKKRTSEKGNQAIGKVGGYREGECFYLTRAHLSDDLT